MYNHSSLIQSNTYQEFPLYKDDVFSIQYLERIRQVFEQSLRQWNRVLVVRFDLRHPKLNQYGELFTHDSMVISKFVDSLNSKLVSYQIARKRNSKRTYPCKFRYIWCKERYQSELPHYHLTILIDQQVFRGLGNYEQWSTSYNTDKKHLATLIIEAWAAALGVPVSQSSYLVHFPENPCYTIKSNDSSFIEQYKDAFKRVSYLAKVSTKEFGDRTRSWGNSRN